MSCKWSSCLTVFFQLTLFFSNGINKTKARQSVIDEMITDIEYASNPVYEDNRADTTNSLQLNTWRASLPPEVDLTPKNKMTATPHKLMVSDIP